MRLGCALAPVRLGGGPLGPGTIEEWGRTAEQLGYSSLWTFDAVGRGFMLSEPLISLALAASATEQLELATGIMQLPIRGAADVAHRALTLEAVAPGRVLLGVGPGSTAADFHAFGGDYASRFERFESQWAELRGFVRGGSVGDRELSPWPSIGDGPALALAGWRGGWVERAAVEADAWIASGFHADDDTLADGLARYRAAGGQRAVVTNVQTADGIDAAVECIRKLGAMGFDDVVVVDFAASRDRLTDIHRGVFA